MKWNLGRWSIAVALVCATAATLLLPSDDPTEQARWEDPLNFGGAHGWRARERARTVVQWRLHTALDDALDLDAARGALAGRPRPAVDELVVAGGPGLPQPTLDALKELIRRQRKASGLPVGRHPVALVVIRDSITRYEPLPTLDSIARPFASTRLIPPADWTGGRCVAVMHAGARVLANLPNASRIGSPAYYIAPTINVLDGCAWYDAFGPPCPGVAKWLDETKYAYARSIYGTEPDSTSIRTSWPGIDPPITGCQAGRADQCSAFFHLTQRGPDPLSTLPGWGVVVAPTTALRMRLMQQQGWTAPLAGLLRDLGAERFQKLWSSPQPIDDAYASIAGEPLSTWVGRWAVRSYGAYHAGPLPAPRALALSLMALAALAASAVAFPRRHRLSA